MNTFSEIWRTEVKELAEACVPEPDLVRLMSKEENYQPTEDEKKYLESISGKYKDPSGMYYISNMIWRIEHELFHERVEGAKLAIVRILATLDSASYFQNVFGGDENNEEWKTRAALRDGLHKLLED